MKLANQKVDPKKIENILRRKGRIKEIVSELILDEELKFCEIDEREKQEIIEEFKRSKGLMNDEMLDIFLSEQKISMDLLVELITRPVKIVKYREDRWGQRAKSLYLKNKEQYDCVKYKCLRSSSQNVMQEVYFRLRDGEESWENMTKQFYQSSEPGLGTVGPIPKEQVNERLMNELKRVGIGKIIKPIKVESDYVVAELEYIDASELTEELKRKVIRDEFERWHNEELERVMKTISF